MYIYVYIHTCTNMFVVVHVYIVVCRIVNLRQDARCATAFHIAGVAHISSHMQRTYVTGICILLKQCPQVTCLCVIVDSEHNISSVEFMQVRVMRALCNVPLYAQKCVRHQVLIWRSHTHVHNTQV